MTAPRRPVPHRLPARTRLGRPTPNPMPRLHRTHLERGRNVQRMRHDARKERAVNEHNMKREKVAGAELIAAERRRQVEAEGWTPEHDAAHGRALLMRAGWAYKWGDANTWPWDHSWWKPKSALRNLVRAGALFQAASDVATNDYDRKQALGERDTCARLIDELVDELLSLLFVPASKDGDQTPAPCGAYSNGSDGWACAATGPHDQHRNAYGDFTWGDA